MSFLSFDTFLSIPVLIALYYLGVLVLPVFIWFVSKRFVDKFQVLGDGVSSAKAMLWSSLSVKQRLIVLFMFIFPLLCAEIFWRMLFEFLIAYMQIRDALVVVA